MLLGKGILPESPSEEVLVSGGGDGRILLWRIDPSSGGTISTICALEDGREEGESILSLAREGTFLYSGRFDGEVNVWDLETRQLVRSLKATTGDVHTLTLGAGVLYAGGKSGQVQVSRPPTIIRIGLIGRRNSTNTTRALLPSKHTTALSLLQLLPSTKTSRRWSQAAMMTLSSSGK
jgi:WD40 repeat protein